MKKFSLVLVALFVCGIVSAQVETASWGWGWPPQSGGDDGNEAAIKQIRSDNNYFHITQDGDDNYACILQDGASSNVAVVLQEGKDNILKGAEANDECCNWVDVIEDCGPAYQYSKCASTEMRVTQDGDDNKAGLKQEGKDYAYANIMQSCDDNDLAVIQTNKDGWGYNHLEAIQTGDDTFSGFQQGTGNNWGYVSQ